MKFRCEAILYAVHQSGKCQLVLYMAIMTGWTIKGLKKLESIWRFHVKSLGFHRSLFLSLIHVNFLRLISLCLCNLVILICRICWNIMQGGHFIFIDNPNGFHAAVFYACRRFLSSNPDDELIPEGLTSAWIQCDVFFQIYLYYQIDSQDVPFVNLSILSSVSWGKMPAGNVVWLCTFKCILQKKKKKNIEEDLLYRQCADERTFGYFMLDSFIFKS